VAHHLDGAQVENPSPSGGADHNRKGADRAVVVERNAKVGGLTLAGSEMLPPERKPVPLKEWRGTVRVLQNLLPDGLPRLPGIAYQGKQACVDGHRRVGALRWPQGLRAR